MRMRLLAIMGAAVLAAAGVAGLASLRSSAAQPGPVLTNRYLVHFVSRDVLPDVAIELIEITESAPTSAGFRYLRNEGDAPADLSRFTLSWFSEDDLLQKGSDEPAGVIGFTDLPRTRRHARSHLRRPERLGAHRHPPLPARGGGLRRGGRRIQRLQQRPRGAQAAGRPRGRRDDQLGRRRTTAPPSFGRFAAASTASPTTVSGWRRRASASRPCPRARAT